MRPPMPCPLEKENRKARDKPGPAHQCVGRKNERNTEVYGTGLPRGDKQQQRHSPSLGQAEHAMNIHGTSCYACQQCTGQQDLAHQGAV